MIVTLYFVAACEAVDGWDPDVCIDAVGGWRDPDECARLRSGGTP